jgi:hypothetical protein
MSFPPPSRYHMAVVRPLRKTLRELLLRREPARRLDYGRCTECGEFVTDVKPTIREAAEITWPEGPAAWITTREPDTVEHFTLVPCGHVVLHFSWIQQGYESIGVNDALAETRRDA